MKKILAMLMSLVLLFSVFPLNAFAIGSSDLTSGITGDCTWTLNGTVLTISGSGATADYGGGGFIPQPWGTEITEVIVEEGVTALGSYYSYAFYGCTNLIAVSLPSTLTYIGIGTFGDCTSLESITIPNAVSYIGDHAFYGCSSLESIVLPDAGYYIGLGAFYGCTNLESITIPDSVNHIGKDTFYGCTALKHITIPYTVYDIDENAFYNCTSLTDVWYEGISQEYFSIDDGNTAITSATWHYDCCMDNLTEHTHSYTDYCCVYCQKKEFLITSIELADNEVEIIENTSGDYNESCGYYIYNVEMPEFTAVLKDGTRVPSQWGRVTVNGDEFYLWHRHGQYDSPWTIGNTYETTCYPFSFSGSYTAHIAPEATLWVSIVEMPIQSITVEDISYMEGTNGWEHNGPDKWYEYDIQPKNISVTLKDGSVISGSYYDVCQQLGYYGDYSSDQSFDNQWDVGEHTATINLMGFTAEYSITITESPVESIDLEDIVLIEGIDSYYNGEYEHYYVNPILSEVIFKDGTKAKIVDDGAIIYNGQYYYVTDNAWDMQYEEYWTASNTYEVTGCLLGASDTFNVTIIENPIEDLELVKMPDSTEFLMGSTPNLKGATIRINYHDGTYEDVVIEDDYTSGYRRSIYSEKMNRSSSLDLNCYFETTGEQTTELWLFGKICEIPVNVKENLMESITIREDADKSIIITVNNSDNTSYDMKVLDISYLWPNVPGDEFMSGILTDKGEYCATIYADEDSFAIALGVQYYDGDFIKSNSLPSSNWFGVMKYMSNNPLYWLSEGYDELQISAGKITKDNIDEIIEIAYLLSGSYEYEEYAKLDGEDIRNAIAECFAIGNVDLSLSEYYDPQTDTYQYYTSLQGMGKVSKCYPDQISYNNGTWSIATAIDSNAGEKNVIRLKLNDELKILSVNFNVPYTSGDADGDGEVTDWDGVLLARYLAGWTVEIADTSTLDIDGDGEVTDWDGVILDRYLAGWNVTIG